MKTLFLIAVVSSVGYLAYHESSRMEQFFSALWFQSDRDQITMESIQHEMQKKLDDVTSEREALYALLAEKEALLMESKQQYAEKESKRYEDTKYRDTKYRDTKQLVYGDEREITAPGDWQNGEVSKRRDELRELAQRMELQALGLGVNE